MTRYAIILGVERYDGFPPTPFAHADASLLHRTLTEACDYPAQHTLLLMLSPDDRMEPPAVLDAIKQAVEGLSPGDSVLFYFAGHGHLLDSRTYLLLPGTISGEYETTSLALDDVTRELRPPQRVCFRLLDACHSGLDVRRDGILPDSQGFLRAVTHDASGWVTLAACREDEYSVADPEIGQGVFTYYLCDYIRSLKPKDVVYPELVKLGITDKVHHHAKRLGNTQTLTFNASISGNVTIAIRTSETHPSEQNDRSQITDIQLLQRIGSISKLPDLFSGEHLLQLLSTLTASVKKELEERNRLSPGPIHVGEFMLANEIPEQMHYDIVTFARQQGLQPRHNLRRWEEEYESPLLGIGTALESLLPKRKRKEITYHVSQPSGMPKSVAIVDIPGDGRCVPTLKLLLYVIPLQLSCCLLVSSFRQLWPPVEQELELLCESYQMHLPGVPIEDAKRLAPFAVGRTLEQFTKYVGNRITQLEKELKT
jgi:hypothetical protein